MKTTEEILDEVIEKIEEIKQNIWDIKAGYMGEKFIIPKKVKDIEEYQQDETYFEILDLLEEVAFDNLGPIIDEEFFDIIKEPENIWTEQGDSYFELQERIDFYGKNGEVIVLFEGTIEEDTISYKITEMNFIVYELYNFHYKIEEKEEDLEL